MRGSGEQEAALKRLVHRQLDTERPGRKGLSATNWILVFLILTSLALYTVNPQQEIEARPRDDYYWINIVILAAFCAEFALRLWSAGIDPRFAGPKGRLAYMRRHWFMVAVDFVAFAPELALLIVGIPPPSWLRTLRVARLFKMARYFPAFVLLVRALRSSLQPLLAAVSLAVVTWYLAAVALYLAEGAAQPDKFGTIADSMWWAVITLTTVGYGDVYPITPIGRVLAGFVAVLGLGTVALPSGIIAGAFMHQLRERDKQASDGGAGSGSARPGDG